MSFRFLLVPKSVTLNDLERRIMALTLRYFTEFGKPAFQHITASVRMIELTDQKSSSVTQER